MMTSLQITPAFERKTAKLAGTVSAGEHIAITIVGGNAVKTSTLYLRIVCCGKTIAQFPQPVDPGETQDEWTTSGENLTATLNLNTVEALRYCRTPETGCLAILEDLGDAEAVTPVHPQLYFVSDCIVKWWPQKRMEEEPYSLDAYPGLISRWETMIDNLSASVSKAGGVTTITIVNKDGTLTTAQVLDGTTPTWETMTGKPSAFPPSTHQHGTGDITGLSEAMDTKVAKVAFAAFDGIANPAASLISLKTCLTSVLSALKGINT